MTGQKIGNDSAIIASLRPLRLRVFALNFLCQHALEYGSSPLRSRPSPTKDPTPASTAADKSSPSAEPPRKSVTDLYEDTITAVRYRCADCGRTFRHCPEGIDRGGQTQRMRGWAALAWALGLSLRSASHLLAAFGVSVSRMSVWRDIQEAGRNARGKQAGRARGQVKVIGADETAVRVKGVKKVVGRESRGLGDAVCSPHPPRFRTCTASNALCQHALVNREASAAVHHPRRRREIRESPRPASAGAGCGRVLTPHSSLFSPNPRPPSHPASAPAPSVRATARGCATLLG